MLRFFPMEFTNLHLSDALEGKTIFIYLGRSRIKMAWLNGSSVASAAIPKSSTKSLAKEHRL
jgi:hypothetical protein